MDKVALNAQTRQGTGKEHNKKMRRAGRIPAVVYGGKENRLLSVDAHEFNNLFKHVSENVMIDLNVEGAGTTEVLVKDYQSNNIKGQVIHIDFYEVVRGQKLHTQVPVRLEGNAAGVRDGGVLEHMLHTLQVECLPKDIPQEIVVDVTNLGGNEAMHVSDLKLPAGIVSLDSPETVIATVSAASGAASADEADGEEEA